MRIDILTKNYKMEEGIKDLISKKLARLDKYFEKECLARVKMTCRNGEQFDMEVAIEAGSRSVRAIATSGKMNENIDIVMPKLERQIVKNHAKLQSVIKKDIKKEQPVYYTSQAELIKASKGGRIVKEKSFQISVTTPEAAVEEMEMLNHDFYIFVNGNKNRVNVLYKRHDGDYGLIDPEY